MSQFRSPLLRLEGPLQRVARELCHAVCRPQDPKCPSFRVTMLKFAPTEAESYPDLGSTFKLDVPNGARPMSLLIVERITMCLVLILMLIVHHYLF